MGTLDLRDSLRMHNRSPLPFPLKECIWESMVMHPICMHLL